MQKRGFLGGLGRHISKISKKFPFFGKNYFYQRPKILRYFYQGLTPKKDLLNHFWGLIVQFSKVVRSNPRPSTLFKGNISC